MILKKEKTGKSFELINRIAKLAGHMKPKENLQVLNVDEASCTSVVVETEICVFPRKNEMLVITEISLSQCWLLLHSSLLFR
jgi:hypothetical protein